MEDILGTILGLLSGIPVIGDIIKGIMDKLGMGGDEGSDDQAQQ